MWKNSDSFHKPILGNSEGDFFPGQNPAVFFVAGQCKASPQHPSTEKIRKMKTYDDFIDFE